MPKSVQRELAVNFFLAALKAADPYAAVVQHAGEVRKIMLEKGCHNILVVGCGKAVVAMARAVVTELKDYVYGGAIITKYDHVPHTLDLHPIKVNEASHPLPDEQGVRGTQEILRQLQNTGKDTLVLCLISGGGSALMVAPADGITLEEKQITTNLLLRSGATIIELNAVRKHISAVKGGGSPKLPTHLQFCR